MKIKYQALFNELLIGSPGTSLKRNLASTTKFLSCMLCAAFVLLSPSAMAIVETYIDNSIKPGANFFQHANGLWLKSAAASSEVCNKDTAAEIELRKRRTSCIDEMVNSTTPNRIKTFYLSLTDASNKNTTLARVQSQLKEIDKIETMNDNDDASDNDMELVTMMVKLNKLGVKGVPVTINTKSIDGLQYISINLGYNYIPGLTKKTIENLFEMAETAINSQDANTIIRVNNAIKALQEIAVKKKSYRKAQMSNLILSKSYNWSTYLFIHDVFGNGSNFVYISNAALDGKVLGNIELTEWKEYLKFLYLYKYKDILEIQNPIYSLSPAEKRNLALIQIEDSFSADLGRLCFDKYLYSVSKEQPVSVSSEIYDIAKQVVTAYTESIKAKTWKDPVTKQAILDKLDQIRIDIGYEYKVERKGYSEIPIDLNDPLKNAERLQLFDYTYSMEQRGIRSTNLSWTNDQDVSYDISNAFYKPLQHGIIITLANLMPPLFIRGDNASNYGNIGFIIGHEIGHMFDKNMISNSYEWIKNEEDRKEFMALSQKFEQQYRSQYSENTLNEDMADMLGLDVAYKAYIAYKASLKGQPTLETKEEIPDDKRFFYSYAQSFQNEDTCTDNSSSYSTSDLRTNIPLKNLDDFSTIFGVEKGNGMFIAKPGRVKFW